MTQQPLLEYFIPSIGRRISILGGNADRGQNIRLKLIYSGSPHYDFEGYQRLEQHTWNQDYNPAVEVAVTSATLRRIMLYHGAIVKVGLLTDCISTDSTLSPRPSSFTKICSKQGHEMRSISQNALHKE